MKIGVLTYHRAHNYGAVLQAFALKAFLTKQGSHVEFIDYWPDYRKGMYDLVDFSFLKENIGFLRKVKRLLWIILVLPEKLIRFNRFQKFIKYKLQTNNKVKFKTGEEIPCNYDFIIYGSDQIWRYNEFKTFKGFDSVYWGEYPKNTTAKKIAYAASMGVMEIDEQQKKFIKKHIENFDLISTREQQLAKIIQPFTKKKVEHILDPVFLLNSNDWLTLLANNYNSRGKYILFYNLNYSKDAVSLVNNIAKELKYRIIEIKGGVAPFNNPFRYKQTVGPEMFISLFSNASFVVATSFHGVAFSIIFRKQFFALGMKNNAERVTSLLEKLNIPERYLKNPTDINSIKEIDYINVSLLLDREKKKSINFINGFIH
jgi:hypothetical protein